VGQHHPGRHYAVPGLARDSYVYFFVHVAPLNFIFIISIYAKSGDTRYWFLIAGDRNVIIDRNLNSPMGLVRFCSATRRPLYRTALVDGGISSHVWLGHDEYSILPVWCVQRDAVDRFANGLKDAALPRM
jgi:hypothetical protein